MPRRPTPGDLFRYQLKGDIARLGLCVRTGLLCGNLIYLYKTPYEADTNTAPPMSDLLTPPMFVGDYQWTCHYFQRVGHASLRTADVLRRHCFRDRIFYGDPCVDEFRRKLPRKFEPCGQFSLWTLSGVAHCIYRGLSRNGLLTPAVRAANADDAELVQLYKGRPPKQRNVPHAVHAHFVAPTGPRAANFDWSRVVDDFEDQLEKLVRKHRVGDGDGHELALDGSSATLFFYGKDADKLAKVLLPAIRAERPPKGSYLLKIYGDPGALEKRISL
ncbi:MAG: hypothetical protein SF069_11535 [Phycisphaerae bacterium]|nr:hypothetical protein [Phycisphaerae bacterium]